ncbi:Serine/threonine-protein phosphatase 5 [Pelomyxa schiedti]|nr:Serine/threonine-protein phosphatase 5 [Pelomyxa schiedti]
MPPEPPIMILSSDNDNQSTSESADMLEIPLAPVPPPPVKKRSYGSQFRRPQSLPIRSGSVMHRVVGNWDIYNEAFVYYKMLLAENACYWISRAVTSLGSMQGLLNEIFVTESVNVVGDLHANWECLSSTVESAGEPAENNKYLFNGDFVDRGAFGLDVLFTLCQMFALHPGHVFLNRGNHECTIISFTYGHYKSLRKIFGDTLARTIFLKCCSLYKLLPLASIITFPACSKRVFVVHGGIGDNLSLDRIRNAEPLDTSNGSPLNATLLWSSPSSTLPGVTPSPTRKGCCMWGQDVTESFLCETGCSYIIRSHDESPEGVTHTHDGKVTTVFSSIEQCCRPRFLKIDKNANWTEMTITAKNLGTVSKLGQIYRGDDV